METLRCKDFMDSSLKVHYSFIANNTVTREEHTHDFWELFLVLRGRASQVINGREETLYQETMALIRPADVHRFRAVEGDNVYLNLAVDSQLMEQLLLFFDVSPQDVERLPAPPACRFSCGEWECLFAELRRMDAVTGDGRRKPLTLKMLVTRLVYHLLIEQSENAYSGSMPQWFREFLLYLDTQESVSCTVQELCSRRGCSPRLVNRMFREYLNTTAGEFLIRKRLGYAAGLLLNSDTDILTISEMAGYHSLSHFIKAFRARYGQTPSRYRKAGSSLL